MAFFYLIYWGNFILLFWLGVGYIYMMIYIAGVNIDVAGVDINIAGMGIWSEYC